MNEHPPEKRIRLVLLDDHVLFRASLSRVLASEPDFEVAGECGTTAEALGILKDSVADVILLDLNLLVTDGNDFMSAARQAGYNGRFLVMAGTLDIRKSALALKRGAAGIFLKSETLDRLLHAIRLVASDEFWMEQKVVQLLVGQLMDQYPQQLEASTSGKPLNDRERNVLLGILGGLTNRGIGDNMGLSESAVKNVVQRLFGRAGVKTRSQLVRVALEGSLDTGTEFGNRQAKENMIASRPKLLEPRHRARRQSPSTQPIT
jgi:two-component system, NarL family, nitrate/nitrite response regulator NarL